jgi:hypothetical protein
MFKQILSFVSGGWLICLLTTTAIAQGNSYGYLLAAPGGTAPNGGGATLHIAGGGQGVFGNGAGISGEVGYLLPFDEPGSGLGLFSINGSYHFLNKGKAVPFITGGYSGFFRSGYANGVNFGAGVNYWFKPRTGLLFEFRDNIGAFDGDAVHFLNVRVGVTFR